MKRLRPSLIVLEFKNVSVQRGSQIVLHNVSFIINQGENVAILGPNGSGKTTLLKAIFRELYPRKGSINVFGQENWDVSSLRSKIGIVSNDTQALLTKEISGWDAVISGFFNSVGLWKNTRVTDSMKQRTRTIFNKLKINHLARRTMTTLSSGEARRILIARALVYQPSLLILDEPMNNLDFLAQAIFKKTLHRLIQAGIQVLLVTHQNTDINEDIDRVLLLKKGRLVADGKRTAVLNKNLLSQVFQTPAKFFS